MKLNLALVVVLCAAAPFAHAQGGGCRSSPENPTAILALVGSAGAFVAMARNRWNQK